MRRLCTHLRRSYLAVAAFHLPGRLPPSSSPPSPDIPRLPPCLSAMTSPRLRTAQFTRSDRSSRTDRNAALELRHGRPDHRRAHRRGSADVARVEGCPPRVALPDRAASPLVVHHQSRLPISSRATRQNHLAGVPRRRKERVPVVPTPQRVQTPARGGRPTACPPAEIHHAAPADHPRWPTHESHTDRSARRVPIGAYCSLSTCTERSAAVVRRACC